MMKKLVRRLILMILCTVITIGTAAVIMGWNLYCSLTQIRTVQEAAEPYFESEQYIPYEQIDSDFIHAVTAVEDKRFFSRKGTDWIALVRAMINNLTAGAVIEGGSTISQQIAKNLYFTGNGTKRGMREKIAEVFLMNDLEQAYSKEELFALYAGMNYYGDGYWGVKNAAEGYYASAPDDLSIAKAAMLAGLPNAPSAYQLSSGFDLAVSRQHKVLKRMLSEDYITESEYETALTEDVRPVS